MRYAQCAVFDVGRSTFSVITLLVGSFDP